MWNWDHTNGGGPGPGCHRHCETQGLHFFESLGLRQFITGYYGSGDGRKSAEEEIAGAANVTGLLGMVYGSWSGHMPKDHTLGGGDYSQIETYAEGARKAWYPARVHESKAYV